MRGSLLKASPASGRPPPCVQVQGHWPAFLQDRAGWGRGRQAKPRWVAGLLSTDMPSPCAVWLDVSPAQGLPATRPLSPQPDPVLGPGPLMARRRPGAELPCRFQPPQSRLQMSPLPHSCMHSPIHSFPASLGYRDGVPCKAGHLPRPPFWGVGLRARRFAASQFQGVTSALRCGRVTGGPLQTWVQEDAMRRCMKPEEAW